MERRRGRVRAGITGYHPTLQTTINPGEEYDVPVQDWSDDLFEAVDSTPLAAADPEPQPDASPFWYRSLSPAETKED